jgi:hypothetical protein
LSQTRIHDDRKGEATMMNTDNVRAQAAREFDSRPALAAEFSSKEAYVAFKAAEARGSCRIFSKPAAPATRSTVGAFTPSASVESTKALMLEFQKTHGSSFRRTELVAFVASRTGMTLSDASSAIADTVAQRVPAN